MDNTPVFDDKRITSTVMSTKAHPEPYIVFRGAKMVTVTGPTRFVKGDKVRIFFNEGEPDAPIPPASGPHAPLWFIDDGSGRPERWMWESNKA